MGAAVAAAAPAAIAWPGLGRVPMLRSPEEAMAAVAQALRGFDPVDAAVSEDGRAALAIARDGRVAVVVPARRRPRACEIHWPALRQTHAGIEIDTPDRRLGTLLLRGVDALAVRRLEGLAPVLAAEPTKPDQ